MVVAIGVMAIAGITWWAAKEIGANPGHAVAEIALVVAFIEYVNKFFLPVRDFSAKYAVMQGAMAATERIVELLETAELDCPPGAAPESTRAAAAGPPEALVAFHDVEFGYRGGDKVLRGVSVDVRRGQTVAVVGATGSGKSTLIKLLTRLYEIDAGAVYIGGIDIRTIPPNELRRRVTVVTQDVFLFAGTVYDNVRLGSDVDREGAKKALQRVGADRILLRRAGSLDAALDLVISERGSNFSAGERQLLAFARALAREPEMLVLDEATAHVDPEAEELIEQGVAELMRGRTTLVIAHRLSTIRNADQIVVMSKGVIVERGTHAELVAAGGTYAALERTFHRTGT
jgi:ATP-binding cassette subfamily B multidrug efflux pump